ncbi:organic solute transporter Ostalpha-domain-containing protein [Coemansia mojavensis]|nr:organic solute transporter Ostalpha-domain-containing protein [Coemansia mojavensis]
MGSWLVTGMVWVAGLSSWAATLVSLGAVWAHCKNYSQPHLQRWVVRIILMVPVYALTAWAALVSAESAFYLDAVRDVYEAFVIYCFVSLLIAYFGGERAFVLAMRDREATPLFWPVTLVRKDLDLSDPYDYLFLKRGILQYVAVKPVLAAATMLLKLLGVYHDGNWAVSDAYLWTQLVYNISVSLSLYCLVVFYMATRDSLAQWRPLPKFLCVKAVVFFSYWQGLGISILVGLGLIHDTPTLSADHIATFLQSWLVCLEMIAAAFGHWLSFSYLDYVPTSHLAGRVRLFHAVHDALGLTDVIVDAKSAWSGHQYTYKHFDTTAPIEERDIHQRRLRAGMRYTQGGKKTYWLPVEPVDHRAVAFAAGGSGRIRAGVMHGASTTTGLVDSAKYIGSAIHPSSRMVHEARRVQRHIAPATENTHLLAAAAASAGTNELADLSMDIADFAADDALYAEARGIEGDFNYPVMEIGVAVGYSRRRPYGHTLPRNGMAHYQLYTADS